MTRALQNQYGFHSCHYITQIVSDCQYRGRQIFLIT